MTRRDAIQAVRGSAVEGLGSESTRAVYRDLLRFGPRSRSELTKRLELSAPTVTRVTRDLLDTGLLRPLGTVVRAKGRPHEPLDIQEELGPRFIGVKVTAGEVHAVVTTVRGNTLEELVLPLDDTAPAALVEAVVAPVAALVEAHPRLVGIGLSLGGRIADGRTVVHSDLLGWPEPIDLAAMLEARLGLPVVLENDLLAMVHGLHWFGIGRAYSSFVVLTIGAGVAIGSVVKGRVIEGRTHLAGLTERLVVGQEVDGRPVTIGTLARTDLLLARARAQGILAADHGIEQLRTLLTARDPAALEVAEELARAMARAAASVVALLDPEAIVLGGETLDLLHAAGDVFDDTLRASIAPVQQGIVVRHLTGDFDEWARGAAVIAIQEFVGAAL